MSRSAFWLTLFLTFRFGHCHQNASAWRVLRNNVNVEDILNRLKILSGRRFNSTTPPPEPSYKPSSERNYPEEELSLGIQESTYKESFFRPVAFSYRRSDSIRPGSRISLENSIVDLNLGWDKRRSIFRCHYPGLYYFTFSAVGRSRGWKLSLILNGQEAASLIGRSEGDTLNNFAMLPLNLEDSVWLELERGQLDEKSVSFSGFRLGNIRRKDVLKLQNQPMRRTGNTKGVYSFVPFGTRTFPGRIRERLDYQKRGRALY